MPKSWEEINREVREARDMIGRLEELALNLPPRFRRRADRIMIAFYLGRIGYREAYRRLKRLERLAKGEQG